MSSSRNTYEKEKKMPVKLSWKRKLIHTIATIDQLVGLKTQL